MQKKPTLDNDVIKFMKIKNLLLYCTGCYKTLIYPISALENKFDPRNTTGMPVVKSIFCLEQGRNFPFRNNLCNIKSKMRMRRYGKR